MPIKLEAGGKDFGMVSPGVHQAICYGVVDIGTQENAKSAYGPKAKLVILFELPFERLDIPGKGNLPRAISMTQNQSLGDKANLRKVLESWRGRSFTAEELKGFDPHRLIGANCQINVVHDERGGKSFANIMSIIPMSKGVPVKSLENPELYFSLSDQEDLLNIKFPENMPDWIKNKINSSLEVVAAKASAEPHQPAPPPGTEGVQENLDEDVPF